MLLFATEGTACMGEVLRSPERAEKIMFFMGRNLSKFRRSLT